MGTHGYMHELLTQHVMQHHAFFVLQQKIVAGDLQLSGIEAKTTRPRRLLHATLAGVILDATSAL